MAEPPPDGHRRPTIVVAEDEADVRTLLARLLSMGFRDQGGVDLRLAGTADEALQLLEASPADLVLTDYRMPGRTGAQLLAEVASRWPTTGRILMTGFDEITDEHGRIEPVDADRVIQKPWTNAEFLAAVREILRTGDDRTTGPGAGP